MKWSNLLLLTPFLYVVAERSAESLDPPPFPTEQGAAAPDFDYVAIIDLGSTGSRVHLHAYEWASTACFGKGAVHLTMPGWAYKTKPGLANLWQTLETNKTEKESSVLDSLEKYFNPIKEYLHKALRNEDRERTVLLLRATGGFRYLHPDDQERALDLAGRVVSKWGIKHKRSWAKVLTGDEEGAYSWLAINQLARRFYEPFEHVQLHPRLIAEGEHADENPLPGSWLKDNWRAEAQGVAGRKVKQRVGMIEVGGASAQIALEPPKRLRDDLLAELSIEEVVRDGPPLLAHPRGQGFHALQFCHENYLLQIQSLDGYGRQAALQRFLRFSAERNKVPITPKADFEVACLPPDVRIPVNLGEGPLIVSEDLSNHSNLTGEFAYARGAAVSDAEKCRQHIRDFLTVSDLPPVPFKVDPHYRIYATENFYYFNQYVNQASDVRFSASAFWERAQQICAEPSVEGVAALIHQEAAIEKRESACFGLVFLAEFLNSIVSLPPEQLMKAVTVVKDLETSFVVGALLVELPSIRRELADSITISAPIHRDEL